jgi:hypothetical protein
MPQRRSQGAHTRAALDPTRPVPVSN